MLQTNKAFAIFGLLWCIEEYVMSFITSVTNIFICNDVENLRYLNHRDYSMKAMAM